MAGNKLSQRIAIDLDLGQTRQQFKYLREQMEAITGPKGFSYNLSQGITSEIMKSTQYATLLRTQLAQATNPLTGNLNLTKFNDQLRLSGVSLQDYQKQLSALGSAGNQAFNSLASSIASAETPLLRTSAAAQEMWNALGNTVRWQATSSLVHGVLSTAASAVSYVRNLDSSLNDIRIVTGQTQDQMAKFAVQANQAAKALNTTTNQYAQAALIYYQQGLSNKQVEERTEATIKLANVSGQSAKKVSDQMTAVWNNFYDGSKSLEYYADVITALGATTASSSEEIARGLSKFSSIAQTTGLSYEYATSALSTIVAATRQSADTVGTSLKTLFSRFQGLSLGETLDDGTALNKYSKALNTVGVSVLTTNGELRDMDNILADLGDRWQNLSKAQQAALAQTIGGTRGYTTLMSLMNNWDSFEKNLQTAQNAQGTLDAQAAIHAESWEAASAHVRAASETIYKNLLSDNFFKGTTNFLGTLLDLTGSVTTGLGGVSGTLLQLGGIASRLFKNQIAEGIDNTALNLRGLIYGQQDIINIREQASKALSEDVNFSRYGDVNTIQKNYNQALNSRQFTYDSLVKSGKIASYMQPVYQSMFNSLDQTTQAAVTEAENYFDSVAAAEFGSLRLRQVAQNNANNYLDQQKSSILSGFQGLYGGSEKQAEQALNSYINIRDKEARGLALNSGEASAKSRYEGYFGTPNDANNALAKYYNDYTKYGYTGTSTSGVGNLLNQKLNQYGEIYQNTILASDLKVLTGANGAFGMTAQDAGRTAARITSAVSGFKQLGYNLSGSLKPLSDLNDEIVKYNVQLSNGTITQSKFNNEIKTLIENSMASPNGLGSFIDKYTGVNSYQNSAAAIRQEMIDDLLGSSGKDGTASAADVKAAEDLVDEALQGTQAQAKAGVKAAGQLGYADESVARMRGNLEALLKGKTVTSLGQGMTTIAGAAASVGSSIVSAVNMLKVFRDETATTGQKFASVVSTVGTLPMTFHNLTKLSESWGSTIAGVGLTVGNITSGLAIAAAAAGAIAFGVNEYNKGTEKTALENFTSAISTSAQMMAEAQQKFEQFSVLEESHNQLLQNFNATQAGTLDNTKALLAANASAQQLIDQYDLKYGEHFTYGSGGEITFDYAKMREVEENAEQEALNAFYRDTYTNAAQSLLATDVNNRGKLAELDRDKFDSQLSTELQLFSTQYGGENAEKSFAAFLKSRELLQEVTETFGLSEDQLEEIGQDYAVNLKTLDELDIPENKTKKLMAAQEILETAAQQAKASGLQTDLAVAYLSKDANTLIENETRLARLASDATEVTAKEQVIGGWLKANGYATEKQYYQKITGTKDLTGISADEIKTTILQRIIEEANLKGAKGLEDLVGPGLWKSTFEKYFKDFEGIEGVINRTKELGIDNLNDFKNLRISEIQSELDNLDNVRKTLTDAEDIELVDSYKEAISDQMMSISKDVIETLGQNLNAGIFESLGESYSQNAIGAFEKLSARYSLNEMQSIAGYITQGNVFYGQNTASAIYNAFTNDSLNSRAAFDAMSKIDWSTSLSSLADLSKQAKRAGDSMNIFSDIFENAVEDIGGEGGLFQQLYGSKGFEKVLEKLEGVYQSTGRITGLDVAKYAEKSEELYDFLQIGRNSNQIDINAGGLAAVLNAIQAGDIKSDQVTSGLVSALSVANQRAEIEAEAFDMVANQDLGESGASLVKFGQNLGKAFYTAKTNNLTMDDPLMAAIDLMPTYFQDSYYEGLRNGVYKSFNDIMSDPKLKPMVDFLTTMGGTGKYKGKGGGYFTDIINFFGTELAHSKNQGEDAQFFYDMLADKGIVFDNNNFGVKEGFTFTTTQFRDTLENIFGEMMTKEAAHTWATIFTEYGSNTSLGMHFGQADAAEAVQTLWDAAGQGQYAAFDEEGNFKGYEGLHFYTEKELSAFYNQSQKFLGSEYGKSYEDFAARILKGDGDRNALLLKDLSNVLNNPTNLSDETLNRIFEDNKSLNETLIGSNNETFTDITSLLYSYGAITTTADGKNYLNSQRFTDLIVASGGSEAAAEAILKSVGNFAEYSNGLTYEAELGTTVTDKLGNTYSVIQEAGQTYEEYAKDVSMIQNALSGNSFFIKDENYVDDGSGRGITGYGYYQTDEGGFLRDYYLKNGGFTPNGDGTWSRTPSRIIEGGLGTNTSEANAGETPSPSGTPGSTGAGSSSGTSSSSSSKTITAEEKWQRGYLEGQARGEVWAKNQASSNPKTYEQLAKEAEAAGGWAYLTENPDKYLTDQQKEEIAAKKYQAQWSSQTDARARAAEIAKTESVISPSAISVSEPGRYRPITPDQIKENVRKAQLAAQREARLAAKEKAKQEKIAKEAEMQANADEVLQRTTASLIDQQVIPELIEQTEDTFGEGTSAFLGRTPIVDPKEVIKNAYNAITNFLSPPNKIVTNPAEMPPPTGNQPLVRQPFAPTGQTPVDWKMVPDNGTGNKPTSGSTLEPTGVSPEQNAAGSAAAQKLADQYFNGNVPAAFQWLSQNGITSAEEGLTVKNNEALAEQEKREADEAAAAEATRQAITAQKAEEARIDAEQAAAREAQAAQEAAAEKQMTGAADYAKEQAGNQALDWITENGYEQEYINTPGITAVDFAKQKQAEITDNNIKGGSLAAQVTADQKHAEEVARASAALTEAAKLRAEEETKAAESAAAASEADQALYNAQMENAAQSWIEQNDLDQERASFTGSNVQFQNFVESRNLARDLEEQAFAAQEAAADLEDMGEDASEQYNKASDLAAQADKTSFTADQLNFQYNMTAEQRENLLNDARAKVQAGNGDQLTAFERSALSALGELVETSAGQYELAKNAEEIEQNKSKIGSNVHVDEETGELVDENNQPVDLPYEQPTASSTPGTGNYPGSVDLSGTPGSTPGGTPGSTPGGTPGSTPGAGDGSSIFDRFLAATGGEGAKPGTPVIMDGQLIGTVQLDEDGSTIIEGPNGENLNDAVTLAVGQNNARILQFAQGHMAVTGELGPELTIREDGSIDMLGQHGREYTWVNPNDIIYTAAQTASILGNNDIEWLEGFAKGFNNKIKGYAPGYERSDTGTTTQPSDFTFAANTDNPGGVNGPSGIGEAVRRGALEGTKAGMAAAAEEAKDPRYDPNTLKERDIVTRYFTILQQIDDITREVEHFGKVAERAWGEERIQAISRQTDAYKEQYAAYQKYMAEIETYLRSDQDALTLMVEEFARDFKEKTSIDIFGGESSSGSKGAMRTTNVVYGGWASGYNNNVKPHAGGYLTEVDSLKSKIAAGSGSSSSEGLDPNLRNPINWVSAEYDANGVLTNYREIVTRLMEVYNENAEAFAQDKEAQYKFQEMLKDIQFYTDSLNLYEQQKEVFSDLRNAILDNQIRKIVYEISYENELDNNALKEINYNFEKIRDNAYRSAEAIDYYATKMDYLDKSNERYKEGIKDILATYSGNVTNGIQRQIMMRLYRKAPMEGYTTVDGTGLSSVAADAGISWAGVTSFKEAYTIEGGDITSTEETTKLAVDHVDENGLIHLNDGSIVDPVKKKRYKTNSDTTEQLVNSIGLAGDWTTSYIEKNNISSTSSSEEEKEELPYFPTSIEIEDYFKNFKAVKIGEETYYVPKDANVDIREDMVQPVDITRAIVDNKGRLSQDEKDLITTQVKSWYDELANMAPELAKDIKPVYENGFMVNFREVMNAINEANAHMSDYMYDLLLNDTEEFFKIWSKVTVENADFQDLTTETATQLESMIDTIYANLQQKEKYIETVIATLGNDIKTFNKDLNAQVDEFEYFNEVMNDYQSIIDLTNRRSTNISSGLISSLRGALLDNAINKVSGTKTVRDTMAQMKAQAQETYDVVHKAFEDYRNELLQTMSAEEAAQDAHYQYLQDRLDQVQDEMDIANAKFEDSNKQFLKAWEDALSKIQSDYTDAVQEATRTFEESFSPFFNTLDLLQAQFEREKALEDYYVDDYQRIHDLASLDRSIEQSILDTDNLKSKGRLRDLQKEINDLQDEGNDLSAYDLDILQKKYDLELARQALEEAKDAKSLVRLARDNNGNWSYVYTSSEEDVSQAEQNYENAIRSMEETNENYIDNLEAQILQVNQSAEQAIAALDPSDFANLDEYQAAIKNIRRGAEETMRYLAEQLKHAFGNNDYLDPFIRDRYNGQNLHNLTNDWGDMTLAVVSGVNSLDAMVRLSQENLGNLGMAAADAFTEYSDKQAEVYATAGADITDANGYFTAGINTVMAMSDENVAKTTALADRVGNAFEKTAAKVRDFNKDIFDLAAQYEKLNSVMIKFLEISGDYVPEEKLDFSTTIDTYKELDEIKQVLGKYGKLIVTDYDEQGNRRIYNLEENTEATAKQFDAWYDAMAKSEAIDVGDDLDTQEEYDKINAYLEKHGQVYISIDGELKKLSKDNEEDMAWLQDKLTAIQEAAKQMEESIAYIGDYASDGPGRDIAFYGYTREVDGHIEAAMGDGFKGWDDKGNVIGNNPTWSQIYDTGGYTGIFADTGMYTGEWDGGSERKNGRLAWLHQKELVLNAHDTENFLDAMNIVRQLDNLASWMANGLGDLFMPRVESNDETLEQNVHIEASFPNAVDHNEIEQAFGNLVNLASQYANRKAFA